MLQQSCSLQLLCAPCDQLSLVFAWLSGLPVDREVIPVPTQPGPAGLAQHLGEDLSGGDSHLALMSLREQDSSCLGWGG